MNVRRPDDRARLGQRDRLPRGGRRLTTNALAKTRKSPTRAAAGPDPSASVESPVSVAGGVAPGGRGVEPPAEGGVAVGVGVTPATTLFSMLAEQMSSEPPPLTESLHWLTVTTNAADV